MSENKSLFAVEKISSKLQSISESTVNTKLQSCIEKMRSNDFDLLGLKDKNSFVHKYIDNKGKTSSISISSLANTNMGIENLLQKLNTNTAVFLISDKGINRIITRADLDKQEYHVYLFMLFSKYESILTQKIINNWDKEKIINNAKIKISSAENKLKKKNIKNNNLHLVYYLLFSQKIYAAKELFKKEDMKYLIKEDLVEKIIDLRNDIAHGKSIYSSLTFDEILEIEKYLKRIVKRN